MSAVSLAELNTAIKYHTYQHDNATDPEARKDHLFALGILCKQRLQKIAENMANGRGINQVGFYEAEEHDWGTEKGDSEC